VCRWVVETPTYLAVANKLFSEEERADVRISWHSLRLTRNVETWSVERADFEKSGSYAKGWGKVAGLGWCISGATRDFRFF
jgi:hypothetical protein